MSKFKFLLLFILIFFTGCSTAKKNDTSAIDGGVFKTVNKGVVWVQKATIATAKGPQTFRSTDMTTMIMDPSDHKALYYGAIRGGLLYTYDGGESWQKARGLGNNSIRSISIDPKNKCVIYATIGNKVFKTDDCNRNYKQIYIDNQVTVTIDAIAVDHYNSDIVYFGNSRGDFIKSLNAGESWQTFYRFNSKILDMFIDPNDSRRIFVHTAKKGMQETLDGGLTWARVDDALKDLKLGTAIKDLVLIKDKPEVRFFATNQGIILTEDNGKNWKKLKLILPDKGAEINAFAVNPKNINEIYYVTNRVFYRSKDKGETWTPTKLVSSRRGWELLIDPVQPNIIYMGFRSVPKK